jgi:hypothetical protein
VLLVVVQDVAGRPGDQIPEPQLVVERRRRRPPPVRADRDRDHVVPVPVQHPLAPAGGQVPHPHRPVLGAGHGPPAGDGDLPHVGAVAAQDVPDRPGRRVPYPHRGVVAARHQDSGRRVEGEVVDRLVVAVQEAQHLAPGEGDEPERRI